MVPPSPSTLTAKLAEIMGGVARIPKKGKNTFHGYEYVLEADLVEAVRDKLAAAKIFIYTVGMRTEVIEVQKTVPKTGEILTNKVPLLFIEYAFVDSDTGEEKRVFGVGEIDQDGGKGIYKAQTGAEKYMLMKNFLIATGDDPEQDNRKAPAQKQQVASPAPQARQQGQQATQGAPQHFPATNAQKNAILHHFGELEEVEKVNLQEFMQKRGIPTRTDDMTKRQASAVMDEMMRIKNARSRTNTLQ